MSRTLALVLTLALAGCASAPPTGPVTEPEIYPDRTTPEATWRSFLWAWRTGDVEILLRTTGWQVHARLRKQLEANTEAEVAEFYRDDALRVRDAEWTVRGADLAYLRVVLSSSKVDRVEVEFSFVERPDGWIVTQQRTLR
ncbi:MAG: hypothetical protein CMF76_10370 [Maricaulis sp.]|nr:hypothetical protein [Maricaulis sp.]